MSFSNRNKFEMAGGADLRRELGPLQESFGASHTGLSGTALIGLGALAYGVVMGAVLNYGVIHFRGNPPQPITPTIWALLIGIDVILVACAVGGLLFIWLSLRGLTFRLEVYEQGLVHYLQGEREIIRWEHISLIERTLQHSHLPLLHAPFNQLLPRTTSTSYLVRRSDNREFAIGSSVKELEKLGSILHEAAQTHSIPWQESEVDFG